ncbi:MAG: HypC/HybG/HupF family hydrogenase formation chaperone [Thermodesulfovibrionales bacterium]|nr:HypC/HybG/HupF family hydrogenase formation chaperone [Thermodesulfovibrionales bacterium]
MCLAIPSKIISIDNLMATVDVMGARRDVSLILLPEEADVGDYVLVHAGFALQKIDEETAQESLKLWREYAEFLEKEAMYEDT